MILKSSIEKNLHVVKINKIVLYFSYNDLIGILLKNNLYIENILKHQSKTTINHVNIMQTFNKDKTFILLNNLETKLNDSIDSLEILKIDQ